MKIKYKGEQETFFTFDGVQYCTKNMEVEVTEEAADYILTNPRWSIVGNKKVKKKGGKKNGNI